MMPKGKLFYTKDEGEFVVASVGIAKRKEFVENFSAKFGANFAGNPVHMFSRAIHLWMARDRILNEVRGKQHTVLVPAKIVSKAQANGRSDNLPDVGELIAKQNNLLAEQNALLRDILSATRDCRTIASTQYAMFTERLPQKTQKQE